jgi:hypothetical protein
MSTATAGARWRPEGPGEQAAADDVPADGSVKGPAEPMGFAIAMTNIVLVTCVHLRAYHPEFGWTPQRMTEVLVGMGSRDYLLRPDICGQPVHSGPNSGQSAASKAGDSA